MTLVPAGAQGTALAGGCGDKKLPAPSLSKDVVRSTTVPRAFGALPDRHPLLSF